MRFYAVLLSALTLLACGPGPQKKYQASLVGFSTLPADTFQRAPADVGANLQFSGKYTAPDGQRRDKPGSISNYSYISPANNRRITDITLPRAGQPIQGFSGIKAINKNEYWATSDNGFGSKANSPDAMLVFYRLKIDWQTNKTTILKTFYLHDADKKLPFHIVNEGSSKRYLTGADLDIESIQPVSDGFFFGDEFGPYLIKTDVRGKVTGFWQTTFKGKVIKSPDHFSVRAPGQPGEVKFQVPRSRGFEAMAQSLDGKYLYPALEGAMYVDGVRQRFSNRTYLTVFQFDIEAEKYTGKTFRYYLNNDNHSLGDFNLYSATEGLIIERDQREGAASSGCEQQKTKPCFEKPAAFKRVFHVRLVENEVKKLGYIDLLDIADRKGVSKYTSSQRFQFPFVTIENVDIVDNKFVIVANDNNLAFSSGRNLGKNDDNEFILLEIEGLFK